MSNSGLVLLVVVIVVIAIMRMTAYQGASMTVEELHQQLATATAPGGSTATETTLVVDVREPDEFGQGHIAGAVNIPLGQIDTRINELRERKRIYVICLSGARSAMACNAIQKAEPTLSVVNITGGMGAWQGHGFPVVR